MEVIKDDMFQAMAEETNEQIAEAFFGYVLLEHHYQPNEIVDACPDFYENLSDFLENTDWDVESLKRFADEQFAEFYNIKRKWD